MSLFENEQYRWRDTYFILFHEQNRPSAVAVRQVLESLGDRFEIPDIRVDKEGSFESLTILSPMDFAGMDISYNAGEDVVEHVKELLKDFGRSSLTMEEREKLNKIKDFTARFEIFHFERVPENAFDEDEEFLDPGGLLIVMERLADFCQGIAVDPQSGAFM
jgi:hypothetical protein